MAVTVPSYVPVAVQAVVQAAQKYNLDALGAVCDAYQESTLDPNRISGPGLAVGDYSGYGLFQLTTPGEFDSLPGPSFSQRQAQALNPLTNALQACSVGATKSASTPGELWFLAQNPLADAANNYGQDYIDAINTQYNNALNNIGGSGADWFVTDAMVATYGTNWQTAIHSSATAVPTVSTNSTVNIIANVGSKVLAAAQTQLGVPYIYGGFEGGNQVNPSAGGGPGIGWDCSGLAQWCYSQAGVPILRTSQQQWAESDAEVVPKGAEQAGDLVFFVGSDGTYTAPGHVGIVVTPGTMIDAPYTGTVVRQESYNYANFAYGFVGIRRYGSASYAFGSLPPTTSFPVAGAVLDQQATLGVADPGSMNQKFQLMMTQQRQDYGPVSNVQLAQIVEAIPTVGGGYDYVRVQTVPPTQLSAGTSGTDPLIGYSFPIPHQTSAPAVGTYCIVVLAAAPGFFPVVISPRNGLPIGGFVLAMYNLPA